MQMSDSLGIDTKKIEAVLQKLRTCVHTTHSIIIIKTINSTIMGLHYCYHMYTVATQIATNYSLWE